jgi:TrmH family RNA methyltransferase
VDWTLSPSALVIGGETTGLSNEACRLIEERGAQLVRIPMVDGVDSLSAAIAASVIVYEAYRQTKHELIKD